MKGVIWVLLIVVVMSGCLSQTHSINLVSVEVDGTTHTLDLMIPVVVTPTPTEQIPEPDYTPTLQPYKFNRLDSILIAENPSLYITPDNDWVKWYANKLFIDRNGKIKYKDKYQTYTLVSGSKVRDYNVFLAYYIKDSEQFKNQPNNDYWINPDYFLTNGLKGDCEDFSLAVTSMLLSGEVSVLDSNGNYEKQVIPAKSIIGYFTEHLVYGTSTENNNDMITEYYVYGNTYFVTSALDIELDGYDYTAIYRTRDNIKDSYVPVFEFTDKYFKVV